MRNFLSACTAVAVLLSLAGCNLAPKYARPPAPTPTAFKETAPPEFHEGAGWKLAQPADDVIRPDWWSLYNDAPLSALEAQVRISNQTIAQAEANYRAAQSLVAYARASLLPRVTTSPSYSRSRASRTNRGVTILGGNNAGSNTTGTTGTGTTGTGTTGTGAPGTGTGTTTGTGSGGSVGGTSNSGVFNNYNLPLNLTYEVDFWHRIRNTIAANAYVAQASAADVATAVLSTQSQLAQDYFELRALDTQRQILDETVENYRQTLALTESRFRGGIASEEDLSQAQTQLDTTIAQRTDLGVARSTYEHAIATLIGKPASSFQIESGTFNPIPPQVPVAVPSILLERRPDIAAAERTVAELNAQIGVQRAAFYPTLNLSASEGFQSSQIAKWFTFPSNFWSLGPSAALTLFDAGARHALTSQVQFQYDAAVASYRETVLTAFQTTEDDLATLRVLGREVNELHTAVQSANHYLQLSQTRYRGGVDSFLNVITAQNTVLSNRLTELQVQLRQLNASVMLIVSLGGGWNQSQLPTMQQLNQRPPTATGKPSDLPANGKATAVAAPSAR